MIIFNASGHVLFTLLFIVCAVTMGLHIEALGLFLVVFGSLLPDIDHRRSTLGRYNVFNRFHLMKHRGKCHTIVGSILLSLPFFVFGGLSAFIYVFSGCMSHILADKLYSFGKRKKAFTIRLW